MEGFTLVEPASTWQLLLEFWQFKDMNVIWVLTGSILLAISASTVGTFAFLRKRSLIGDALAHAALPGVMMAFLLFGTRDPLVMFAGAMVSSFIGFYIIDWLPKNTKIKPDAALAITLSFFFALGLMLLSYIQRMNIDNKSGLDKILFGQAAAMTEHDIQLLLSVTIIVLLVVITLFQKFRLIAFNLDYARTLGVNVKFIEFILALLIVMSVVVGLQIVGVVLMAAVLLTPVAAARLWSDSLGAILVLGASIGALSAIISTHISYLGPSMPTGPWMVVSMASLFFLSFLFAPQKGLVKRWLDQKALRQKVIEENILRTLFKLWEASEFKNSCFNMSDIQAMRSIEGPKLKAVLKVLCRKKLIIESAKGFELTQEGQRQSTQLTRRHRLWEQYLNEQVSLTPEQVHSQAEWIEHILTPEQEKLLEAELQEHHIDPHGKNIPAGESEEPHSTPPRHHQKAQSNA